MSQAPQSPQGSTPNRGVGSCPTPATTSTNTATGSLHTTGTAPSTDSRPQPQGNMGQGNMGQGGQKTGSMKSEAREELNRARTDASHAADQLRHQGQKAMQEAKAEATHAAEEIRAAAEQGYEQARSQTVHMLEKQKSNMACSVNSVKDALQCASRTLRDEHNESAAGIADAAAQRVGRLGDYLERRPLSALMADAEDLTRRRPEVVLGGLFVAGLAAARFLKASSHGPTYPQRRAAVIKHPQAYHVG